MVVPVIEVVITSIGDRNSQDESTEVGKKYVELFAAGAKHLAGLVRACWGQSYKYPDTVMHFIGKTSPIRFPSFFKTHIIDYRVRKSKIPRRS